MRGFLGCASALTGVSGSNSLIKRRPTLTHPAHLHAATAALFAGTVAAACEPTAADVGTLELRSFICHVLCGSLSLPHPTQCLLP